MSNNYVPLYRKYRPQTLDTLVGQEHVKKALTSAIELGKIAHAFLFTGPRGTGKTSTARILAKSLNCKNGPTVNPCGECESCRDITNSVPIDVIEIDAASNRSVEDAQNILEKIQYAPVNGKYKIYIIDEVHMLTNTAFNALLKTLEEPPENVVFILATTEVHKVLDTIKSRCQRFDFRRITTDDIVNHLRKISDLEKINITDDALFTIAKNAAGGMRDSLSLLDQLSLLGATKQITSEDVNSVLGRLSFEVLNKLSSAIISSSSSKAIEMLNEIYNMGNEPLQILTNLSEYFKNLLITKNCDAPMLQALTGLNEPQIEILIKQKDELETQQIVFLIERISYYIRDIKFATNQYLLLEVCMIDLSNMTENTKLLDLQNRILALENGSSTVVNSHSIQPVVQPVVQKPIEAAKQQENKARLVEEVQAKVAAGPKLAEFTPPPMSKQSSSNDIGSLWKLLLANIQSPSTKALLNLATPVKIASDEVIITFKNDKLVSQISTKKQMIVDAADIMFGQKDSHVTIRLPQPNDDKVASSASIDEKKKVSLNVSNEVIANKFSKNEITPHKQDNKQDDKLQTENKVIEISDKDKEKLESDQEKMILNLFDGKFIE